MGTSNNVLVVVVAVLASCISFGKADVLISAGNLKNDSAAESGGEWSQWTEFGLCSVSCGLGSQSRARVCINSTAGNGSSRCVGDSSECQECTLGPCPVDGGWSDWSCYSMCTKTCSSGVQHRSRNCTNPLPLYGGNNCTGPATVERPCNEQPCPVDGALDCNGIRKFYKSSGVYEISPAVNTTFKVWCDMEDQTGWTVIQRRMDGSVDFYRGWEDYKAGFGSISGEYWLGLDKLHILTIKPTRLRVKLEAWDGEWKYAEYSSFFVDNEANKYQLKISGYSGTAGDSLALKDYAGEDLHNGRFFSTKDRDNDLYGGSCAEEFQGAWWYKGCYRSSLNGLYIRGGIPQKAWTGIVWMTWKGDYGYKQSIMEIAAA